MRATASLVLTLSLATCSTASAQDSPASEQTGAEQRARERYALGEAAFKAGRFGEALTEFEAGFAIVPRPGFELNIGHTYRKLGNLRNARSAYKKYLLMEPESKFRDNVLAVIAEIDSALAEEDRAAAARAVTSPAPPPAPPVLATATPMVAVAPVAPARSQAAAASSGSLLRRPWLWVAVGALAAGAAAGLYLWQRPTDAGFQASGTLGALRP